MAGLITLLVFVILAILSYLAVTVYAASDDSLEMRFRAIEQNLRRRTDTEKVLGASFSERVLVPLAQRFSVLQTLSPAGLTQYVDKRLLLAGGMAGLTAGQLIALSGGTGIVLSLISLGLGILLKVGLPDMASMACYFLAIGVFFPFFMLSRKIAKRQISIQKDLPDVLDLVTVSVEAGLGFDGALAKLTDKMKGTLVDEFGRVLQEMRMGVTRRDALRGMSTRCQNKDLSMFISALIQADQLGVSIGSVLRTQASAIRQNRRNQIEQKATKAPIKMLFPLVTCIFPSLFIILLGPALLKIFTTL